MTFTTALLIAKHECHVFDASVKYNASKITHLSIHPFSIISPPALRVAGVLEPIPVVVRRRWGYTLDESILTHSHSQFRVPNLPNVHVFGQWVEAQVGR